ncbi:hypothetical protein LVX13_26875 [Streptomyces albulus]|uniref:hypothetical protein n=1 Tax=Streptomyces noursei TaxID=1971 RepID=UPI001F1CFDB5|nr:hypothetical protein [Streptomyces noursei]MCE4946716.1 hypothetical protein [Streptomyces noursei]
MASATTGEAVFLCVPDDSSSPWRVLVQDFDGPAWTRHEMTFGEREAAIRRWFRWRAP